MLLFRLGLFAQWDTDRILSIGQNALYFDDYVLSIQYFNQVIKIKPFLSEPYMYRCIAKIQLGDYEGAEIDGTEAISRNPFLPRAFYARGFARMKLAKYEEAAQDFTKALEFSPQATHLLLSRMDAYERLGKYEEVLKDIDAYMHLNPKNAGLLYEKGRMQLALKDTVAAGESFDKYIAADSTSPIGWSARALLKLQLKDMDGAYQDYSKAIRLKSNYAGDYINRGIINVEAHRFMEALSDYDQAIKLDPSSSLAYNNRAILRASLGDDNNALSDYNQILKMDSANTEARYNRALLEMKLRNYRQAIADFKMIIDKHPYFLPAYGGLSEAYAAINNVKEAFRYRQLASNLDQNKDGIREKIQENLEGKNKIAEARPQSGNTRRTDFFNRDATENRDDKTYESPYADEMRGSVQKNFVDVINEKSFVLSYYSNPDELRRTNLYHPLVENYNRKKILSGDLKITCHEIPLPSDLINRHFETINEISLKINANEGDADLYFYRAIEFALVQDFASSIEDLNKSILLKSDFALAYFMRANVRYKFIDYQRNNKSKEEAVANNDSKNKKSYIETEYKFDVELIMRDLDKVTELQPDFSFAYYNKANILCTQQDFQAAIQNYTKAISIDGDFAEAYFNRGLTYLFTGQDSRGLSDMSKSGELGIYGAYNLIRRFNNNGKPEN